MSIDGPLHHLRYAATSLYVFYCIQVYIIVTDMYVRHILPHMYMRSHSSIQIKSVYLMGTGHIMSHVYDVTF